MEEEQNTGKAKIEVYTSPTCPHCPSAVALVNEISKERDDVKVKIYSLAESEGSRRANRLGIMATPTILVKGKCSNGYIGFRGTPSRKALINAIDKALCLVKEKEKKKSGFLSAFKKLLSD